VTDAAMSLDRKRVIEIGGASGMGLLAVLSQELGEGVIASSHAANVDAAVERPPGATGSTFNLRDETSVSRFFENPGAFDHPAITAGDWGGTMFAATRDLDLAAARDGCGVRF
jgi:hypothetical protein